MPILTVNGQGYPVSEGVLLSEALSLHAGTPAPCGGMGLCGKCRVTASGALSPPTGEEQRHLTAGEQSAGLRLACQTRLLGDAQVTAHSVTGMSIQTQGATWAFPPNPLFTQCGIAVDLGTTTLAAALYDRGGELSRRAAPNPQAHYGADVLSRVGRALEGGGGALAHCVRAALSGLILALCDDAGRAPGQVDALVITGNTAMLYLLTETDPRCLSAAPFQAGHLFGEALTGADLDLPCPGARVWLPPCVSAFVGADLITALLASGLCRGEETALLADIGTNGEMALWHRGQLTCCSTAAGPAFEGGGLSMGMPGAAGAVDHLRARSGVLEVSVIGGGPPVGLCGSGAIDALAALLALGRMDETGALEERPAVLAPPVVLTQADVRALQTAKSAIRAGLETLLAQGGADCAQVSRLCLAGGFGSYLDRSAAAAVGLIPPDLEAKAQSVGNAALSGAAMLLQNRDFWPELGRAATRAQVLDLNQSPLFASAYIEHMLF